MNEVRAKIYFMKYPSSLDDTKLIARISGGLQSNFRVSGSRSRIRLTVEGRGGDLF